jgi:NAD(P)-dependent dehydrogenase (short-subunit alcohol dehydrogenase family)
MMKSPIANTIYLIFFSFLISVLPIVEADQHQMKVHDQGHPTVFITGSNRGIGLALARNYAIKGWNVIATCRSPERADDLIELLSDYPNISIEKLDVTDLDEIESLAKKYEGIAIDVLINNAGILGDIEAQTFGSLDQLTFEKVMAVNAYGPLKVAEAFSDNVALSEQKKIVSMTSGLGSMQITGNTDRFYFYRMSKAALNMGVIAMNVSLKSKGVMSALIAPGMVDTQLLGESGYAGPGVITTDESAIGLMEVIEEISPQTIRKNRGKATNYNKGIIPW